METASRMPASSFFNLGIVVHREFLDVGPRVLQRNQARRRRTNLGAKRCLRHPMTIITSDVHVVPVRVC